jgi:hypothetical protein
VDDKANERARTEGYQAGYADAIIACDSSFNARLATLASMTFKTISKTKVAWPKAQSAPKSGKPSITARQVAPTSPPALERPQAADDDVCLKPAEQRIIDALGFWRAVGNTAPTRIEAAREADLALKKGHKRAAHMALRRFWGYHPPDRLLFIAQRLECVWLR